MKNLLYFLCLCPLLFSCENSQKNNTSGQDEETLVQKTGAQSSRQDTLGVQLDPDIRIEPISHATAIITWKDSHIYVDPVGGAKAFQGMAPPDLILITDIHGDHLDVPTLKDLQLDSVPIIAPMAVRKEIPDSLGLNVIVMNNSEELEQEGFSIKAIPMYNLRKEASNFHEKGRGNGYVIKKDGKRIYIAGDTEDIPEMRNLRDIDIALIPMNLPYTMPVEAAADAVIEFQPKKVVPYHFRGQNGMADIQRFEKMVREANPEIEVVMLDWYPKQDQ